MSKKAFTLIELMVSILIGSILLNFIFTFQFNFMKEVNNLKSKEELSMHSFKLMEVVSKGVEFNTYTIPGVISAKSIHNGNMFKDNNSPPIEWRFDRSSEYLKFDNYIYRYLNLNSNVSLAHIENIDGDDIDGLYRIQFSAEVQLEDKTSSIDNPEYTNYTRIIYTK